MWILAKPLTCRSNTNSGPLHSRIHGLALRLKGNSFMDSPRKTNPRPQSKLWTWKSETWALQIKFLLVKKSMRSSVVTLKGTFIFFRGGTSPGGRAKAWIHSQESAHGHQWPVPKVWTTEAERRLFILAAGLSKARAMQPSTMQQLCKDCLCSRVQEGKCPICVLAWSGKSIFDLPVCVITWLLCPCLKHPITHPSLIRYFCFLCHHDRDRCLWRNLEESLSP